MNFFSLNLDPQYGSHFPPLPPFRLSVYIHLTRDTVKMAPSNREPLVSRLEESARTDHRNQFTTLITSCPNQTFALRSDCLSVRVYRPIYNPLSPHFSNKCTLSSPRNALFVLLKIKRLAISLTISAFR